MAMSFLTNRLRKPKENSAKSVDGTILALAQSEKPRSRPNSLTGKAADRPVRGQFPRLNWMRRDAASD
jgi:hypothetical protein